MKICALFFIFYCLLTAPLATSATPQSIDTAYRTEQRTPCHENDPLRKPFFGDTHVHTKYSLDASTQGTRTTPAQAYQFAKGERVGVQPWDNNGNALRSMQLSRPLDFAMVTDHAELMGEVAICNTPAMEGYTSWQCKIYRGFPRIGYYLFNATAMSMKMRLGLCGDDGQHCIQAASIPWQEMQQAAEDAYDRSENCEFSSFVAFEWTGVSSSMEGAQNRHRNVIFRNEVVPALPITAVEHPKAHQLWDQLDKQCVAPAKGCDVLVIPHNSNLSDGSMFTSVREDDKPITAENARQTARFETLVEVMQHKGSSECYFGVQGSIAADELCAFEQLPYNNFRGQSFASLREAPRPEGDFLREALRDGLRVQQQLGVNPFKWGFIGSTDTHLGTPGATAENNFLGHGGAGAANGAELPKGLPDALEFNPGGLAVLWAEENTRDSLFAAMRRREAYGTSGPRMTVRFFGGWDYPQTMCETNNFAERGYNNGVPMGGDLSFKQPGLAPYFAVQAFKDAGTIDKDGTPLQRIQIIKGWVDDRGESKEAVYDIAGNPDNGARVDLNSCEIKGPGHDQLCAVWQDPDFNENTNAWYYARVVENPTCRWSQQVCNANRVNCSNPSTIGEGLEGCCAAEHRPVIQERAWTSPIWYSRPSS